MRHDKSVCALLSVLTFSVWLPGAAMAQPETGTAIQCPDATHFFRTRPVVPTPAVAKAIYIAIGNAAMRGHLLDQYPKVLVEDLKDKWAVGQTYKHPPPKPKPSPTTVIVSAGGGDISMTIDKCTGAILEADGNR